MTPFETARAAFEAGVAAVARGELQAAEAHFEASLAVLPGRPSTLANLGAVRLRLGRPREALVALDAVVALEPDSEDVLLHRGLALAELGRLADGVQSLDRLLARNPGHAHAWGRRGAMLKDLGRIDEAARSLRRALELGDDPALHRFVLASIEGGRGAPEAPPPHYVEQLFDSYSEGFDEHLVGTLGYDAPRRLLALLPASERLGDVLDLGCGSGLAAPHWAPRCSALDGVDLSSRMLAKAHGRGLYRRLTHADAVAHLATLDAAYATILAADVFIYIGALDALMPAARRALQPGGRLVFTVEEAADGSDWRLASSTRYQHGERHLRALAAEHGYTVTVFERGPLRRDQQGWIGGIYAVYARP